MQLYYSPYVKIKKSEHLECYLKYEISYIRYSVSEKCFTFNEHLNGYLLLFSTCSLLGHFNGIEEKF